MTLLVLVSAYSGAHASLTNVSQTFKYTNLLLKRCSKIGEGDVMLLFQDIFGAWIKYDWVNWLQTNGRKSILSNVSKQQNLCLQQLQNKNIKREESIAKETNVLSKLKECISECHSHSTHNPQISFIYHIAIIGNEHCLSFHGNNDQNMKALNEMSSQTRITPINISMICLSPPLPQSAIASLFEFELSNNCCTVCNQQFFRTKPNKKQHFPKSCHQIALKQIRTQKWAQMTVNNNNTNDSDSGDGPPFKKRKVLISESEIRVSKAVIFYQRLIDNSKGIFRWILTDFNQSNIDCVFQSVSAHIASHTKVRYISMGTLLGKCVIFPGPNNGYFAAPNNANLKIAKFESLNERQIRFEISQNISQTSNAFTQTLHSNVSSNNRASVCPLNILHSNTVQISQGCDVVSILGFLSAESEWLPIPVLSRHFVCPLNERGLVGSDSEITVFINKALHTHHKLALVSLNPPNKPLWLGFIHSDSKSKGKYLILDILSPFINVEQLLLIAKAHKSLPHYCTAQSGNESMLSMYDRVSAYLPSQTNVSKEFDKFVRLFRQRKILDCFEIAESIRKRAQMFHIPHLISHLKTITEKETQIIANQSEDNNCDKDFKFKMDILCKLVTQSVTDKKVKIVWNSNINISKKQQRQNKNNNRNSGRK